MPMCCMSPTTTPAPKIPPPSAPPSWHACPEANEVGDRAEAILRGVDALQPGDALLIAGKGHETGQIIKAATSIPLTMWNRPRSPSPRWMAALHDALWTSADAAAATGGRAPADWQATGVSIDTRTLQPGDLFVALKDVRDGHDFVAQALAKGAAAALVSAYPRRRRRRCARC